MNEQVVIWLVAAGLVILVRHLLNSKSEENPAPIEIPVEEHERKH
jgi:hypothetical protein